MIQENVHIQEVDIHHIDTLVSDNFHFHDHVIIRVLDIFIWIEASTATELHMLQDTKSFIHIEEILELLIILPPEILATVLFLDLVPEVDKIC